MRRITLAAALAATLAGAPSAQAAYRSCGDIAHQGAGVYTVEAQRVSCRHARWIARRYQRILFGAEGSRGHIGRFRCRSRRLGEELFRTTCNRGGGRVVRFEWGS